MQPSLHAQHSINDNYSEKIHFENLFISSIVLKLTKEYLSLLIKNQYFYYLFVLLKEIKSLNHSLVAF